MDGKYRCRITSELLSDSVTVTIGRDRLTVLSSFSQTDFPFIEITGFYIINGSVHIDTEQYQLELTPDDPEELTALFSALWSAYDEMVLRSFQIRESPHFVAEGDYIYSDSGDDAEGRCRIALFRDCLFLLPPNPRARRIPLCYITSLEYSASGFTAALDDDSYYTVMNVGADMEQLKIMLDYRMSGKDDITKDALTMIDRTLDKHTLSRFSPLLSGGRAASFAALNSLDPLFVRNVGAFIKKSPAERQFMYFMKRCLPTDIRMGVYSERSVLAIWLTALRFNFDGVKAAIMSFSGETVSETVIFSSGDTSDDLVSRLGRGMDDVKYNCSLFTPCDPEILPEPSFMAARSPSFQYLKSHMDCIVAEDGIFAWARRMDTCF